MVVLLGKLFDFPGQIRAFHGAESRGDWLSEAVAIAPNETDLSVRINELVAKGFKSFDAFHLASAELSGATAFLTVDLQILSLAARVSGELHVPVTDPVHFIEEISQWKH